jgi:hypothetical protein
LSAKKKNQNGTDGSNGTGVPENPVVDPNKPVEVDYDVVSPRIQITSTGQQQTQPQGRLASKRPKMHELNSGSDDRDKSFLETDGQKSANDNKTLVSSSSVNGNSGVSATDVDGNFGATKPKNDTMTVTVRFDQRTLMLNLRGSMKGFQLINFALREFRLGKEYTLQSEGVGTIIDASKPLREQVPMFDILKVVKIK